MIALTPPVPKTAVPNTAGLKTAFRKRAVPGPVVLPLLLVLSLGACDRLRGAFGGPEAAPVAAPPPAAAPVVAPQGARTAAAFDRTTEADRQAARAVTATGGELGKLVVTLGNPAEQGFWLRSALVKAARPGVVRLASGASVQVDLLPATGGGPQLSLAAYRALGLGLTDLPTVTVLTR